ncbi:phage tail tape measure protein [Mycobacterium sp. WY10]|nr:phage tail tape measure protein [Mycobacterium sp. WY10]
MPLTLLIESELDERSATAAANRAERVYAEASRNIARSMTSQIGDGAQAAGRAIDKMTESAQASYRKVLAAQDELAQQERQLKQMREDGARGVEVQSERVRQARRAEKDAIREAAAAFNEYERATQRVGESGARAGDMLRQGLRSGLENGVSDYTRQFGVMGNIADNALSGISTKALAAGAGIGAITLGAVTATKAIYDLGKQWDDISDSLMFTTGRTGADLQNLTGAVGAIGSTTATSLENIRGVVGQLSQAMPELDVNSGAFRIMGSNLSYLAENGNGVDVRKLVEAFHAFGVPVQDSVKALDDLAGASRNSQIPINELISNVQKGAPQFRQFGLSIGQSTSLMALFEQAGLNAEDSVTGLRKALANLDGSRKGLEDALTQIKALHDMGNDAGAQSIAEKVFGVRNFAPFLQAIESGRLSVDALNKSLENSGISLQQMQEGTDDGAQGLEKLSNTIKTTLGPIANSVFGAINTYITSFSDEARALSGHIDDTAESLQHLANVNFAPDSALGRMLNPTGPAGAPGINAPLPLPTTKPGTPVDGLGPNPYKQWYPQLRPGDPGYAGNDNVLKPSGGSSSSDAQVPYGPGYGAPPRPGESTAMYQAEQNVLEAQHRRATAEAQLAQVVADGTHTTNDEVKARNDLAQARKGEIDAQMRLLDTTNKAAESLNKAAGQLSDFGASIDADLGISKGLPGIADNLVRFLGSLALAGPMAQLSAISAANPNQGSGLMGYLGSTGAFGPQYTPQAIAAAGSGGGGGYTVGPSSSLFSSNPNVNSMLALAQAASGRTAYAPASDLIHGLADCSGSISDLYEVLTTGASSPARMFTTTNFASDADAAKLGFQPGYQPGAFNVGVNPYPGQSGHMAATLPNGVNFEGGGGTGGGAQYGGSAAGALNPEFEKHYYLPVGGAPAAAGGSYAPLSSDQLTNPGLTSPALAGGGTGTGGGFPGLGGPPQSFRAGADPFGVAPTAMPGSGGPGVTPGGSIDTAIGIAAAGADLIAPGAGAAAQAGAKLISRGVQYAGQVAGIAADGWLQTLLPAESQKAGSGWLQRGVGAIASVKPALPNLAGGKSPNAQSGQGAGQGQQPGQPIIQAGDTNINVTNQRATEDGTGKDIAFHQSAQNSGPGWL